MIIDFPVRIICFKNFARGILLNQNCCESVFVVEMLGDHLKIVI